MGHGFPCSKWYGRKELKQIFKQKKKLGGWVGGWVRIEIQTTIPLKNLELDMKKKKVCCSSNLGKITMEVAKH
jgi:hypothetical protein